MWNLLAQTSFAYLAAPCFVWSHFNPLLISYSIKKICSKAEVLIRYALQLQWSTLTREGVPLDHGPPTGHEFSKMRGLSSLSSHESPEFSMSSSLSSSLSPLTLTSRVAPVPACRHEAIDHGIAQSCHSTESYYSEQDPLWMQRSSLGQTPLRHTQKVNTATTSQR